MREKMNRIVEISKYAIKFDNLNNDWQKVDKALLKKDAFKCLKIGDYVQVLERSTNKGKRQVIKDIRKLDTIEVSIRFG